MDFDSICSPKKWAVTAIALIKMYGINPCNDRPKPAKSDGARPANNQLRFSISRRS